MNKNPIDLPEKVIEQLRTVFSRYGEVKKVLIFGSRVLGNAKPGSDVDLAFSGENLTPETIGRIRDYLEEETLLPYFFDCVHLESIDRNNLLKHIQSFGKVLYER